MFWEFVLVAFLAYTAGLLLYKADEVVGGVMFIVKSDAQTRAIVAFVAFALVWVVCRVLPFGLDFWSIFWVIPAVPIIVGAFMSAPWVFSTVFPRIGSLFKHVDEFEKNPSKVVDGLKDSLSSILPKTPTAPVATPAPAKPVTTPVATTPAAPVVPVNPVPPADELPPDHKADFGHFVHRDQ